MSHFLEESLGFSMVYHLPKLAIASLRYGSKTMQYPIVIPFTLIKSIQIIIISFPQHVEEQSSADLRRSPEKQPPQSSIAGIPNDFPKLPKFPLSALPPEIRRQQPQQFRQSSLADLPKFVSKPEVPEGGLGPVAHLDPMRPNSVSISESGSLLTSNAADGGEYGGSSADSEQSSAPGGLIGTVLDLFGFNKEGKPAADAGGIGRAVGSLLGGNNSPLPGKQMISNVKNGAEGTME